MSAARKKKIPNLQTQLGHFGSDESQIRYRLATYDCGPTAEKDFVQHAKDDIEWLLQQLDDVAAALKDLLEAQYRATHKDSVTFPEEHVSIDECAKVIRENADSWANALVNEEKSGEKSDNEAELEQAQKALADEQADHAKTKAELIDLRGRIARAVRELHNRAEEATAAE